ncbi:MAG TPA: flagellar biosynthetic protein FliO [bacterium]|nr:flagellar biosynthetic protein FliO [bacterium]
MRKAAPFLAVLLLAAWTALPARAVDADSPLFSQNAPASVSGQASPVSALALPEETPNPAPSFFSIVLRLFFALALTLGLIYLTVWGLKLIWEKQGWSNPVEDGKPLRVLGSMHLGPRKTIQVVEVGKRLLVLGVGHEEIHRLAEITDAEEIDQVRRSSLAGFPHLLNRVVRRQEGGPADPGAENVFAESKQVLGGYLEKLKTMSKRKKDKDGGDSDEK